MPLRSLASHSPVPSRNPESGALLPGRASRQRRTAGHRAAARREAAARGYRGVWGGPVRVHRVGEVVEEPSSQHLSLLLDQPTPGLQVRLRLEVELVRVPARSSYYIATNGSQLRLLF